MSIKIGELAKRAGLTVRTLHHYDNIGLLSPSSRSENGFRLYNQDDVIRLQRIQALKQFGCSLSVIRTFLTDSQASLNEIIAHQISVLDNQMQRLRILHNRLLRLNEQISKGDATCLPDWLTILEVMAMYEKHFSQQELDLLHSNKVAGNLDQAWKRFISEIQDLLDQGIPVTDEKAQEATRQWMRLMEETTGNDPSLALKLRLLHKEEAKVQLATGITMEMVAYISQAMMTARAIFFRKYLSSAEFDVVCKRYQRHLSDWPPLIADVRRQMKKDTAPNDPAVQALAHRWKSLFCESFAGDDLVLAEKIRSAIKNEPELWVGFGLDLPIIEFIHRAINLQSAPDSQANCSRSIPKPTALRVAQLRAVHQLLDSPLVFEDPLALKILGKAGEDSLRKDLGRYNASIYKGLRTSVVVRSRLVEDELARSYQEGLRQYVILGAGLDTFAYRNGAQEGIRIFEVDLPTTQQWKRDCLYSAGIDIPATLTFVSTDFETLPLKQALERAGFKPDRPAFFSWLGVTMYLETESVQQTLQYISSLAPGSAVVFDYGVVPDLLSPRERKAIDLLSNKAADHGEPWKTFFNPASLDGLLRSLHFTHVEDFGPELLNDRFLSGRKDGLHKSGVTRLIFAKVE
jgi:methyltransferase (TIGR00027 family)